MLVAQNSAVKVLDPFRDKGFRQFVLSAMQHEMLEKTLELKGILHFFEGVAGLKDHYAVSKTEQGKQLIRTYRIDKREALLIGDTTHDFEVATELGVKCILIADGHQSIERLMQTKGIVMGNLSQLLGGNYSEL